MSMEMTQKSEQRVEKSSSPESPNLEDQLNKNKSFPDMIRGLLNKVVSLCKGSKNEIQETGKIYKEVVGGGQEVDEIVMESSNEVDSETKEYISEIEAIADPALVKEIITVAPSEGGEKSNDTKVIATEGVEIAADDKKNHLEIIGENFKKRTELEKRSPLPFKNRREIRELDNQIKASETKHKNEIAAEVTEFFKKFDMNDEGERKKANTQAMNEIIIPRLKEMETIKIEQFPPKDKHVVKKCLENFGKVMPNNKLIKDITIASIIAVSSVAFSAAAFPGLPVYLGSKIVRSVIGSVVGEKVSSTVDKISEKHFKNKAERRVENFPYNKEDIDATADQLVRLGENDINDNKKREKFMKYAKIAIHIGTAGAVMSSLEPFFSGHGLSKSIFNGLSKSVMFAGIELGTEEALHNESAHHAPQGAHA